MRPRGSILLIAFSVACNNDTPGTEASDTHASATQATSGGTSSSAAETSDSSTAQGCEWTVPKATCEVTEGCLFRDAGEVVLSDGVCESVGSDPGWCVPTPAGHSDSPSWWYHAASQRVFVFAVTPIDGPEGWERCACDAAEPDACGCDPQCSTLGSSSTSGP